MAILPHRVTLTAPTTKDLSSADDWCRGTWPYTHGATWYCGWFNHSPSGGYTKTWSFQFKEDAIMFQLTWSDWVVTHHE